MAVSQRYFSFLDPLRRRRSALFLQKKIFSAMRRMLEDSAKSLAPLAAPGDGAQWGDSNFDSNMVIVLAALLIALICAFALRSLFRIATRRGRSPGVEVQRQAGRCLTKKTLKEMPMREYGQEGLSMGDTDCPICLGEFANGEKIRILPRCNHGFHARCIDAWLVAQPSCPFCRRSILDARGCNEDAVFRQQEASV